jgi:hypothetical protein
MIPYPCNGPASSDASITPAHQRPAASRPGLPKAGHRTGRPRPGMRRLGPSGLPAAPPGGKARSPPMFVWESLSDLAGPAVLELAPEKGASDRGSLTTPLDANLAAESVLALDSTSRDDGRPALIQLGGGYLRLPCQPCEAVDGEGCTDWPPALARERQGGSALGPVAGQDRPRRLPGLSPA